MTNPSTTKYWLAAIIIAVSGCTSLSTKETKYFSLKNQNVVTMDSANSQLSVGLGPFEFPQLLDRPHLVTRDTEHKIRRAEFQQWGGSLEREFLEVLADHIGANLGTSQLFIYPWNNRRRPEYQIRLNVSRFDGQLGGDVTLSIRWQILSDNGKQLIATRHSQIFVATKSKSYSDYVSALAEAVKKLADEISLVEALRVKQ